MSSGVKCSQQWVATATRWLCRHRRLVALIVEGTARVVVAAGDVGGSSCRALGQVGHGLRAFELKHAVVAIAADFERLGVELG